MIAGWYSMRKPVLLTEVYKVLVDVYCD